MHSKTIAELGAAMQAGEFSSVELTRHFIERIERLNGDLNALITPTPDQALAEAEAADRVIRSGQAGPLTGIPLVQKDIFCTQGVKTSCGSRMLDSFISPYDATVVERLKQAGTVSLGKANMDEFAMGSSNETSYYGPVRNPWDQNRVPGGSSGGSAAAVAARIAVAGTGTDTGGSIRQPAALCGITGLKPTYGRVSRFGMIAFASSLDQAGPMTRSAEDAAMLLQAMAGFDSRDSTCADQPVPDYSATLNDSLRGLKIGLPREYFDAGLDSAVAASIDGAIGLYKQLGAEVVDISLPNTALAVPTYYVVAPAECSSNLSRFDGVRFGYRCEDPKDLEDLYKRSRGEGFGAEVKRRILIGTYALSAGYYDAYYLKAQKTRHLISDDFKRAFETVDVIMGPTTPTTAFALGEKTDDPVTMYLNDIYTIAANLAGLPGISIPVQPVNGLPVGLQIIGNYFTEGKLLNVAHRLQAETDWHLQTAEGFA
ncbi:MAG: Asp-tRNA(Asn)/Glu-tRNA(Gln) amidotransferase subunit GatA [Candidatus Thiodiazotropha sp. (ex Lucina aurantia)]|uniref:Glutamyl-tRNA(Gln) amidotransferase subunit A n=1 Tax=Candidatus Thiodiazotropha endolucinida TaxID=1655433 RepID=A0A7Z0VMS8_9GAMM|nr:Asp-tRNA(Asn)/Glu-tRNA(Gln) amidotransferase subunit GatA [Candidatus Thiodiazotropha endolucinida]MBT3011599.1 Asp-tRNA(Asn)/Glu-tRNA(Gln) amidotransferase subunit GatA [Candidatus Thiodiazotropha sp. (ex Lucina pensylvanica)]MBT3023943.1 Asp-tRNA(Asn)/Glu-tRNA(Gln) amidotransferase subunit GatA [Candidatus Thiodiazotropha taylori]MBT3044651.1 Asp-tRNA(Asn)/Glu-tRNA(Gln) amidotransferase subunit GatA [Candidatus Thiodiazotropha sp. (ex Codakia orbicularis)]MBV2103973.1 Asp-tRNA(Asn)/Glu-tRN